MGYGYDKLNKIIVLFYNDFSVLNRLNCDYCLWRLFLFYNIWWFVNDLNMLKIYYNFWIYFKNYI